MEWNPTLEFLFVSNCSKNQWNGELAFDSVLVVVESCVGQDRWVVGENHSRLLLVVGIFQSDDPPPKGMFLTVKRKGSQQFWHGQIGIVMMSVV